MEIAIMSRLKKELLRSLTDEERTQLERFARSPSQSAVSVARAKSLLAVAEGKNYTQAAQAAGRKSGDAVSHLVTRFNQEGIASLHQRHGGGPSLRYQVTERETILAEARRAPDRELDGTATWSLSTLQRALRKKGLTQISTYTIWHVLKEAGLGWQTSRAWCETGTSWRVRRRKSGNLVEMVVDPDAEAKKKLIESAYREAERQGLAVWCEDEAGPYQAIAQSGQSWEPLGHPVLHPHEYIRGGTAKMLTLLHPASGQVRVKGVISSTNVILHSWLKEQLQEMVAALPTRVIPSNTGEKERDRGEGEGPGRMGEMEGGTFSSFYSTL